MRLEPQTHLLLFCISHLAVTKSYTTPFFESEPGGSIHQGNLASLFLILIVVVTKTQQVIVLVVALKHTKKLNIKLQLYPVSAFLLVKTFFCEIECDKSYRICAIKMLKCFTRFNQITHTNCIKFYQMYEIGVW